MKRILLLVLVFLAFSSWVFAQTDDQGNPNDPMINDSANACYEGGNMESKCDTEWEWICGWYMIRFDYGIFSREEIPVSCRVLLPGEPPEEITYPTTGCIYLDAVDAWVDFKGGNYLAMQWDVYTPGCAEKIGGGVPSLVYAPYGRADALAICRAHGHNTIDGPIELETDIYMCFTS